MVAEYFTHQHVPVEHAGPAAQAIDLRRRQDERRAWLVGPHARRVRQAFETGPPLAFGRAGIHLDIGAGHQGIDAGDTAAGELETGYPELGFVRQILLCRRQHPDVHVDMAEVIGKLHRSHRPEFNGLVFDLGARLESASRVERDDYLRTTGSQRGHGQVGPDDERHPRYDPNQGHAPQACA